MLRELGRRIKDITQLLSLLNVLIVIGRNDGSQDTGIPVAVVIHPIDPVLEVPIGVAEGSEDQLNLFSTAGDIVGRIVRVLNRQAIPVLEDL